MKTSTEVLTEILKEVMSLKKEMMTNNFLLKSLLARGTVEPKKEKKPPTMVVPPQEAIIQEPIKQEPVKQEQQPLPVEKPIERARLEEEKFVVVQLLTRDGSPVFLATISISNSKDEVVFTGTTSSNGQWNTTLPAGTYFISVKREARSKAPGIDINDSFSVSANKVKNGKITLPPIKL